MGVQFSNRFFVSLALALFGIVVSTSCQAQQPAPLPFDPALSVYVAHTGTWYNYNSQLNEAAEVEDSVAAFQPFEELSDEPSIWADHQINLPQAPAGFTYFEPAAGEPMQLHVIIRDTQNRLGSAAVTDWETGTAVGALTASPGGGEISGQLTVNPSTEGFALSVKTPANAPLFSAGVTISNADEAIIVTAGLGWQPNRGNAHDFCPIGIGEPYGHPRTVANKTITRIPQTETGCGAREFLNDLPLANQLYSPYQELCQAELVVDDATTWLMQPTQALPPNALTKLNDTITAIRTVYLGKPQAFKPITLLPYSKGAAHWPMTVLGEATAILYFPYRGKTKYRDHVSLSLQGKINVEAVIGNFRAAPSLVASIQLTEQERKEWQVLPPVAVGDIWGLRVTAQGDPTALPNENITQDVTFELWGDITVPDGTPGLLGGSGTTTIGQAWTQPAPPPTESQPTLFFPSDGPEKGRVTVKLGKGWYWSIVASVEPAGAYSSAKLEQIRVPVDSAQRLTAKLDVLFALDIKTIDAQGNPSPAYVDLEKRLADGTWAYVRSDNTSTNGQEQVMTTTLAFPGTYRVRANAGEWQEFGVNIGLYMAKTITVPDIVPPAP